MFNTHRALGWLRYARYLATPQRDRGTRTAELAAALVQLAHVAHAPELVPSPLRSLIGDGASARQQRATSQRCLTLAQSNNDPNLVNAGILLLTAVADRKYKYRSAVLSNLGHAHWLRFRGNGHPADLSRAIDLGEQSLATPVRVHGRRRERSHGAHLNNLAVAYLDRFDHGGPLSDVDRSIELLRQASMCRGPGYVALTHLCQSYLTRFRRTGVVDDLDRAAEVAERFGGVAPLDRDEEAGGLFTLGILSRMRYAWTGRIAELDHAIEMGEQAVAASSADPWMRPIYLTNLAGSYRERGELRATPQDLDRAIERIEEAIKALPPLHTDRPAVLSQLSRAYRRRYELAGTASDLDQAVEVAEQSLAAAPDGHRSWPEYATELAVGYRTRSVRDARPADLQRATELADRAVAAVGADDPSLPDVLATLARCYQTRLDTGQILDTGTLGELARRLADATDINPMGLLMANRAIGVLARSLGEDLRAVELLDTAVSLLPSIMPTSSAWADREHRLGSQSGLAAEAVAAHCAVGDPVGAVQAAELSRGIILAAELDLRTDLEFAHEDLAARLNEFRVRLNAPEAGARQRLRADYDRLLSEIRRLPGFERFLLPPSAADLRAAASGGPVVMVNAASRRSDAIVIQPDGDPLLVPLPALRQDDARARARVLLEATQFESAANEPSRSQHCIQETLAWLWDVVAEPILGALPSPLEGDPTQRVWWMPIGLLGLFPLHAAGRHGEPGALDHFVSSYAPTLRTLTHARRQPPSTTRRQLTVAIPDVPEMGRLPAVTAEVDRIHHGSPNAEILVGEEVTADRVLAALPDATWVHFACHARSDLVAPSASGFLLLDRTLSVSDISQLRLTHAELAYLSACSTADRGIRHVDESLTLASAFHLAGFRHVIASLWPLPDRIAANTARAFYDRMNASPAANRSALVLREIAHGLRARYPDYPGVWTPLIHSGA